MKLTIEVDLQPNEEVLLIDKIRNYCVDWFNKVPVLQQHDVISCKEFIGQLMIKLQELAELQDRDFDRTVINHKIGDLYTALKVINEYSAL